MNVIITNDNNGLRASLEGRFDTVSASQCKDDFQPLIENADKQIVIDCSKLDYISSSGLRVFLTIRKAVEAMGGKLIVEHINDEIHNVFSITGFLSLFDVR